MWMYEKRLEYPINVTKKDIEVMFNSDVANANYEDSEIRNVLLNWYNMNLIKYQII